MGIQLKGILSEAQANWSLISGIGLAAALCFNIAYFQNVEGNSPFVVGAEDLAKSFIYIVALWFLVQNFIFLFQDLTGTFANSSTRFKLLLVGIAIAAVFVPSLVSIWQLTSSTNQIDYYYETWTVSTRLGFLFGAGFLYLTGIQRLEDLTVAGASVLLISIFSTTYSFGKVNFYVDARAMRTVEILQSNGTKRSSLFLTRRSNFFVLADIKGCTFELIEFSKIDSLRFPSQSASTQSFNSCI